MKINESKLVAAALNVGANEQQASELAAFLAAESKTLTTTTRSIVTHTSGTRHWSHLTCTECETN